VVQPDGDPDLKTPLSVAALRPGSHAFDRTSTKKFASSVIGSAAKRNEAYEGRSEDLNA
jgi:hypothetical protein